MASRYTHIDIAKGIGILFVIFGHNWIVSHEKRELFNIIFSFHVPLFFFLSGLFMNYNDPFKEIIIKKSDSYIKPYYVILFLLGIHIVPSENINPINYFARILYGTGQIIPWPWGQLWFLPHLWAVSLFSYLCYRHAYLGSRPTIFKAAILVIILSLGYLGIYIFRNITLSGTNFPFLLLGLPFSMDLILISSFYFLLGSFLKQYILNMNFNWLILIISVLTFSFIHHRYDITIDLNVRRYDNIFLSTVEALLGTYLVITVSIIFQKIPVISRLLSYIGSASIFILIFHNYIQIKSFDVLNLLIEDQNIINSILSFLMAVIVPLLLYELVKRNSVFKILLLPVRSTKGILAATTERHR